MMLKKFCLNLKKNVVLKKFLFCFILTFLFLYFFSIPSFSGRKGLNIISYCLMGILIFGVFFYSILYGKFFFNKIFLLPLIFVLFAFVGTIIYSKEYRRWLTLVLMVFTFFSIYFALNCLSDKRLGVKTLVFSFFAFSLYFVFHYKSEFININSNFFRVGADAYFDNVNAIGFYFSIGFSVSIFLALFRIKKIEFLYFLPALVFLGLGFATGSRSFIIIVVAASLFIIYLRFKKNKIVLITCFSLFVAFLILIINVPFLAFLKTQFEKTLFTVFGFGSAKLDVSTLQRVVWQKYAFYLSSKNMLLGFGCNGFSIFSGVGTYAHNNFAEVACDFGIIGFFLFNLTLIIPFFYAVGPNKNECKISLVLILILLVRSFFGVIYYTKETYLILAICYFLIKDEKTVFEFKSAESFEVSI